MGRVSQFVDLINTKTLKQKQPINMYYKTKLTHIDITDKVKSFRKDYLRKIKSTR